MQHSYPDYVYYRDHNRVFTDLSAYGSDPERVSWTAPGQTELIEGQLVSGNFFSALGVRPALGRWFLPDEDQVPGKDPVVVLNHDFWQQRLGADPNVLGRILIINAHSFAVVGVAPADFRGVETGFAPDFWVPIMMQREIVPADDLLADRTGYWLFVVGRLKPRVPPGQAQADLSVLARQLAQAFPKTNKGWDAAVMPIVGIPPEFRQLAVPFSALLMAVVGLVLLIACANAANLFLAKASRRSREMAIRSALGASRGRIIRQILTESTLLSLAAGILALGLAASAGPLLLRLKPPMLSFIKIDLPPDWRVLVFTFVASLLAGFAFGVGPALRSAKVDVVSRLKDETSGGDGKGRLRNLLVTAQIAICTVLLIGAGLCLRSLMNAQSVDPGFQVNNRLMVSLDLQILGYSESRGEAFYGQLIDRVKALPGVRSASIADHLPLGFERTDTAVAINGYQPPPGLPGIPVSLMNVGPGYFHTMGTPLLRGREFSTRDNNTSPGVVIINEAMARRYWAGRDPIGQQVTLPFGKRQTLEIVGVVATGKYRDLREDPQPFMYRPFLQAYDARATLVVQTAGDPKPAVAVVEREIHTLDVNLPVLDAETMTQYMSIPLFAAHVTGTLLGAFGLLALLLALVGLSGVVAYLVSQRTREIGVHLALGASRNDVLKLVVRQGVRLSLIGMAIGLAGAFVASRVLSSLLYGIRPTDPITFICVSLVLAAVTLIASYLPARRAIAIDPMVALRYE